MTKREQLEAAIRHLESQRSSLGDAVADAAVAAVRQQLTSLDVVAEAPAGTLPPHAGAERKLVTVMFADISGFTALSERLDPEQVRDFMNDCFSRLVPIIAAYGGTVDKFIGDEIMALFGAPVTHENDPERALRAALEMRESLGKFNGERGLNLGMHFGINTGPVIAGIVGYGERTEYSVMGDAVNLASRLEDASERGEILVGPDTYRLTEKLFTFEARSPLRVKGKSEPVKAYVLTGLKVGATRLHRETRGRVASGLVAREGEFAALYGCMERLINGQGAIASVVGDAGMGKSRLVAEVRKYAIRDGIYGSLQWYEGRTPSFGRTMSYRIFQEILWHMAGIPEDCPAGEALPKLESVVGEIIPDQVEDVLPYLASLMSLEVRGIYADRLKYLDPDALRRQIFFASRRFFQACAEKRPLVLLFDDLHWADESSTQLIEHLIPLAERVPVLFVTVNRLDPHSPCSRIRDVAMKAHDYRFIEIRLSPLSRRDGAQLVRNLLGLDSLPAHVLDSILLKAEGNPLFLEEIVHSLIDEAALVQDPASGRWKMVEAHNVTIPDTIQGVIMARVDRLGEDLRRVLKCASVIGRSFLYKVLRAIEEENNNLERHLADLERLGFIHEKRVDSELQYAFKQAIAQQATYESILVKVRRTLHAKAAEAIESLFSDRLEEMHCLLASHYARAEVWDKAHHYLLLAGDHAGRVAADAEALAHYREAMVAYERGFSEQWEPSERAALDRKMGEALFRGGEPQQAWEYLNRALQYMGKPLATTCWGVRIGIVKEILGQLIGRTLGWVLYQPLDTLPSRELEDELRTYEVIGWIDAFGNYEHFFLVALRALNVSEREGYTYGISRGLTALGTTWDLTSLFRLAGFYHRRALVLAERIEHPAALGLAHIGLAVHHVSLAQWDEAIAHSVAAELQYRSTGDIRYRGNAQYLAAVASAFRGDCVNALRWCAEMVELGREGADPQLRCWGLSTRGHVLRLMARFDEAIEALTEAAELSEVIPDHVMFMWSRAELGRCYLGLQRVGEALEALKVAESFFMEHANIRLIWVSLRNAIASCCLATAEQDGGHRPELLQKAGKACRDAMKNAQVYRGLLPEALKLYGTYWWFSGKQRKAKRHWLRSRKLAERLGQRIDLAMVLRELGMRTQDHKLVKQAETMLSKGFSSPDSLLD
jgi:class 3 adenylate cyclase/tetratricopeptide (TPR) repeat protein